MELKAPVNHSGLYQGTTFSRAERCVAKDTGFSPCKMHHQGLKPSFFGDQAARLEAVP